MDATKSELETNEIQNGLFGRIISDKKPRKPCPKVPSIQKELGENGHDNEPPRQHRNYAADPVTTRMYLRKDLHAITITAPDGAHAPTTTIQVLPGHPAGLEPGEYHQLTADVYTTLRAQIDRMDLLAHPEDKRSVIIARWEAVVDFAMSSGLLS